MPLVRKRRAPPEEDDPSASSSDASSSPPPTTQRQRQRRRVSTSSPADNDASDASSDEGGDSLRASQAARGLDVMVKKLVRLALASEYSRQPIRRNDISVKVLGEQGSRQFKTVFEKAQKELRERFGMQMAEQPVREKITISQRRAAQRTERTSSSSKSWTLITTLPSAYRTPTILTPAKAPSSSIESSYTALYTFIISLIMLCGGSIQEQKLERYLRRVNADHFTPIDTTTRLIARLCKEGYLVRNRDVDGGEEVIEYYVGPRGKIEVGVSGVSGLVKEVYGFGKGRAGGEGGAARDDDAKEFEMKLNRSLGIRQTVQAAADGDEDEGEDGNGDEEQGEQSQQQRRNRRSRRVNVEDDDDDED